MMDDGNRIQAHVAQLAEHVLGKDEVSGSSPDMGSIFTTTGHGRRDEEGPAMAKRSLIGRSRT